MIKPVRGYRSKCCHAKVKIEGIPDFLGRKEVCTYNFSCLRCRKPCDAIKLKGHKRKACTAKKRIQAQKKRLDFQGKVLRKLLELLDGITIHPVKGVMLTPKKKLQLAELRRMEQKLNKQ